MEEQQGPNTCSSNDSNPDTTKGRDNSEDGNGCSFTPIPRLLFPDLRRPSQLPPAWQEPFGAITSIGVEIGAVSITNITWTPIIRRAACRWRPVGEH